MSSMLRPRRHYSSSSASLPSYCDYGEAGTIASPVAPIHDFSSSSSSFNEDDIYDLAATTISFNTDYLRRRNKVSTYLSWHSFLIRSFFVLAIFGIVGYNLRSRFEVRDNLFDDYSTLTENPQNHSDDLSKQVSAEVNIQRMAKAMVLEKFGRGPHFVEFELNIWEGDKSTQHFFTVEMAPIDLMPVTVYFFLEQISRGLWSGTSIHLNADHVIASRPVSGNGQISKREMFEESGFGTLPFQEYNEQYPHLPYTLGIANGPAFYINKKHNTHKEACFGEVVIGRSTIDKIATMRGYDHDPTRIRPIDIVAARRLSIQDFNEKAAKAYLTVKASR